MIYPPFRLQNIKTEQGLHPGDILVEMGTIAYASGTCEIPTSFSNGNVIGVLAMRVDSVTIAADGTGAVAFTSDLVVSNSPTTITVVTTAATTNYAGTLFYIVFGRVSQY